MYKIVLFLDFIDLAAIKNSDRSVASLILSLVELTSFWAFLIHKKIEINQIIVSVIALIVLSINYYLVSKPEKISEMREKVKNEPKILKVISVSIFIGYIIFDVYLLKKYVMN